MDAFLSAFATDTPDAATEAVHVTPAIIARLLDVSPSTVDAWCRGGQLRGRRVGRQWRVPVAAFREFLELNPHHALRRVRR